MTTPQKYESHALADLFPLMDGAEFAELVASIKENGLRLDVLLYEGRILDGRNRYRACAEAGVECRFKTYTGDDPLQAVIDLNMNRRHLNESQRAWAGQKIANLRQGGGYDRNKPANLRVCSESEAPATAPLSKAQRAMIGAKLAPPPAPPARPTPAPTYSQADAAKRMNVSERSIQSAKVVAERGTPELGKAVERGQIAVSAYRGRRRFSEKGRSDFRRHCLSPCSTWPDAPSPSGHFFYNRKKRMLICD